MGNVVCKHAVWRQDQNIGRRKVLPVVVQKIGDPVQSNRGFSASGHSLDRQDLIPGIAYDRILLLLDGPDDVLKLYIPIGPQFFFQDFVVDLGVAFKGIDQPAVPDLILPFRGDLSFHHTGGRLIGCRPLVVVVKQLADRRAPVIDQRCHACPFSKVGNSDIEGFRILLALIAEIHPAKERGLLHLSDPSS